MIDYLGRPEWDPWFMTLAFIVAQRSLDKQTKHGCIVVGPTNAILSVGYNSPPRNCIDHEIPLERPAKYKYFEHSEGNAITNAARHGISLEGSTFYITGHPCSNCFRQIVNVGAIRVVYGIISHQHKQESIEAISRMNRKRMSASAVATVPQIEFIEFTDNQRILALLESTRNYLLNKIETQNAEKDHNTDN